MSLALVMQILFVLLALVFVVIALETGRRRGKECRFLQYLLLTFYLLFTVTALYATYNQIVHHEFSFTLPSGIAMLYGVLCFQRRMKM